MDILSLYPLVLAVELWAAVVMLLMSAFFWKNKGLGFIVSMLFRLMTYGAIFHQIQTGEPLTANSDHWPFFAGVPLGIAFMLFFADSIMGFFAVDGEPWTNGAIDRVLNLLKDRVNVWARLKAKRLDILGAGLFAALAVVLIKAWADLVLPGMALELPAIAGSSSEMITGLGRLSAYLVAMWICFAAVVDYGAYIYKVALPPVVTESEETLVQWIRRKRAQKNLKSQTS